MAWTSAAPITAANTWFIFSGCVPGTTSSMKTRAAPGRPLRLVLDRGALVNDVEQVTHEGQAPFVDEPAPYDLDPATVGAVAGAGNDALKAVQSLPGVGSIPFGLG